MFVKGIINIFPRNGNIDFVHLRTILHVYRVGMLNLRLVNGRNASPTA